ncbi:hypothetical protein P8605_03115 [Streptomyces sp. T-3]|nr:hypothetical protein [Streptomyces sp. T-3]
MRTRTVRVAAACLASSSLLFAAACDGSAKAGDEKPKGPQPLTGSQAKSVIIGAGDLTEGWKQDKDTIMDSAAATEGSEHTFGEAGQAECRPFLDALNNGRLVADYKVNHQAVFSDRAGESMIAQDVSGYALADAESGMKKLAVAVAECTAFETKYDGETAKVTAKKLELPALGDETIGYRLKFAADEWIINFEVAAVRQGANITTVYNNWGEGGERGEKAFRQAYTKAAANLKKALGGDSAAR